MNQVAGAEGPDRKGPSVSIVVPIYNVEPYLEDCLSSLLSQDFGAGLELILVNDCSPDDSAVICEKFENEYPRIVKYIQHPENRGVSAARNTGIETASGEYLMFVDPDDILPESAVRLLHECAERYDADIVKGNNTVFTEQRSKGASYNVKTTYTVEGDEIFAALLRHEEVRGHPWGKLFSRRVIASCRFPENVRMAQDLVFCARVFSIATRMVFLDEIVYGYRLREDGSTGNKYRTGGYEHWFNSVESLGEYLRHGGQKALLLAYQVRTLHQAVKELRKTEAEIIARVLPEIVRRKKSWGLSFGALLKNKVVGLKVYWRFFQFRYYMFRLSR